MKIDCFRLIQRQLCKAVLCATQTCQLSSCSRQCSPSDSALSMEGSVMQFDISIIRGHMLWLPSDQANQSQVVVWHTKFQHRDFICLFFFFFQKKPHQNKLETKISYLSDFSSTRLRFLDTISSTQCHHQALTMSLIPACSLMSCCFTSKDSGSDYFF